MKTIFKCTTCSRTLIKNISTRQAYIEESEICMHVYGLKSQNITTYGSNLDALLKTITLLASLVSML